MDKRTIKAIKNIVKENPILNDIDISDLLLFWVKQPREDKRLLKTYLLSIESTYNYKDTYYKLKDFKNNTIMNNAKLIYSPEFQALKYNINIEDAVIKVSEYKRNKATSYTGFINRHGEDAGADLFNKFQKTSSKGQKTKNSYGEEYVKSCSPWCKEYYIKRGYSSAESIKMVSEFQRNNSGVSRFYWLGKGYTKQETDEIISAINKRKACGIDYYKTKYGKNWEIEWDKRLKKLRITCGSLPPSDDRDFYYFEVYRKTKRTLQIYKDKIDNIHLRGTEHGYDLDHIFSIKMGYIMDIPPDIIAHWTNIKITTAAYNRSKQDKCDKTFDKLIEDYNKHESIKENSN